MRKLIYFIPTNQLVCLFTFHERCFDFGKRVVSCHINRIASEYVFHENFDEFRVAHHRIEHFTFVPLLQHFYSEMQQCDFWSGVQAIAIILYWEKTQTIINNN